MRTLLGWCVVLVLATGTTAYADDKPDDKSVEADRKFEEAQKLRDAGKVKEACDTFRAALTLNPNAIGTILNIARCAEEEGKTGAAVRWFTEARDRAKEQNLEPQRQAAEKHLDGLVPHVPHLAIAFAEAPPPDARILVDDRIVDKDSAGDIIVDPGRVRVVVSAPGRVSFESTVVFDPKGDHEHKAISVPKLGLPVTVKSTRTTVGKILTFSGAGIALGSIGIALVARSHYRNAINEKDMMGNPLCTTSGTTMICDPSIVSKVHDARTLGDVGTVVGIAGLTVAAAGVVLWLVLPAKHDERPVAIVPVVDPTQAGLAAVGRF